MVIDLVHQILVENNPRKLDRLLKEYLLRDFDRTPEPSEIHKIMDAYRGPFEAYMFEMIIPRIRQDISTITDNYPKFNNLCSCIINVDLYSPKNLVELINEKKDEAFFEMMNNLKRQYVNKNNPGIRIEFRKDYSPRFVEFSTDSEPVAHIYLDGCGMASNPLNIGGYDVDILSRKHV